MDVEDEKLEVKNHILNRFSEPIPIRPNLDGVLFNMLSNEYKYVLV